MPPTKSPSHLWVYFWQLPLAISTGYQSAMGVEFFDHYLWKTGVPTAALALTAVIIRLWYADRVSPWRRGLISGLAPLA